MPLLRPVFLPDSLPALMLISALAVWLVWLIADTRYRSVRGKNHQKRRLDQRRSGRMLDGPSSERRTLR